MRLHVPGLATLTAALLLAPAPAVAGGWWSSIELETDQIGAGETLTAEAEFLFSTVAEAEAAPDRAFHAYLLLDEDRSLLDRAYQASSPDGWWTTPEHLTLLGAVDVSIVDSNLAHARATFTVPAVTPGRYGVMFCDAGCSHPMGDIVPRFDVQIFGDAVTAQTVRQLRAEAVDLKARIDGQTTRIMELSAELRTATNAASRAREDEVLTLEALESRLDELAAGQQQPSSAPGWLFAGLMAGVMLAMALRRRSLPDPVVEAPATEPLGELISRFDAG